MWPVKARRQGKRGGADSVGTQTGGGGGRHTCSISRIIFASRSSTCSWSTSISGLTILMSLNAKYSSCRGRRAAKRECASASAGEKAAAMATGQGARRAGAGGGSRPMPGTPPHACLSTCGTRGLCAQAAPAVASAHLQLRKGAEVVELRKAAATKPEHLEVGQRRTQMAERCETAAVQLEVLEGGQPLAEARERHKFRVDGHLQEADGGEVARARQDGELLIGNRR